MKFSCSVKINAPREKVVEMFKNPDNLKQWQDGFISKTLITGEEMQNGAVSEIMYEVGKRDMALIETILSNDLPDSFEARYEHTHTSNTMKSIFEDLGGQSCQYTAEINYTRFNGFMVKLFATLAPSMFKKQVQKWIDQFKAHVEASHSEASI